MLNLREVDEAKELMTEAARWSVMKWLGEKKRVRKTADQANHALDVLDKRVKDGWSAEFRTAYDELASGAKPKGKANRSSVDIKALAAQIKQADDEAYKAHMDAEDTFDAAERRLSTSMAREGTHKAILSWDLREKAILLSQSAVETKVSK